MEDLKKDFPPSIEYNHGAEMIEMASGVLEASPTDAMVVKVTETPDQSFKQALTLNIKKPGDSPWGVKVVLRQKHQWQKGETGMIAFYARTLATKNKFGASSLLLQYKPDYNDWRGHVQRDLFLTKKWKLMMIPFEVKLDAKNTPGSILQLFFGGVEPQTIQLADLHIFSYGKKSHSRHFPNQKPTTLELKTMPSGGKMRAKGFKKFAPPNSI